MIKIQYITLLTLIYILNVSATSPNPTIGFNFTAMNAINAPGRTISVPQNPTAGVGKTQFISCTYQGIRSFNKFTGEPDGILNVDATVFSGDALTGEAPADVWLLYHTFLQRWFFSVKPGPATLLCNLL